MLVFTAEMRDQGKCDQASTQCFLSYF